MERKRVLIAFVDIIGFKDWTINPSNDQENFKDLIDKVYDEFEIYIAESGCDVKLLGDGLMAIMEIKDGFNYEISGSDIRDVHNCEIAAEFLKKAYALTMKVSWIIKGFWPRPDGVRLRSTAGYVWKRLVGQRHEYIGHKVNLAKLLLGVFPETLSICHGSTKEIIGDRDLGINFDRMEIPEESFRGLNDDDLSNLFSFFAEMPEKAQGDSNG